MSDAWAQALTPSARWALACLSGVLNGVAFVFWGPAALFANVPLLIALRGSGRVWPHAGRVWPHAGRVWPHAGRVWRHAGLGGVVGVLAGAHIYGILDYGAGLLVAFSLYCGSQMVLYGLLHRLLYDRLGRAVDVALPMLIWTLTEWIRTIGPLAMPASYVGCIADVPALRPWLYLAPHLGGLGVSSAIALFQSVLFHGLVRRETHGQAALGGLIVLGIAGGVGWATTPPLGERPVQIVGVQGGLANAQYKAALIDPLAARDIERTYATLSARAYAGGADLVVWPETAVRTPVLADPAARARLFPPPDSDTILIAGLLHREGDAAFNLAAAIHRGRETSRYLKVRTVPRTEDYLTRGTAWTPLDTPLGPIGVLICLESVYPQAARELVANGAELLLVPTNDAGFGRSPISGHMTRRAIVRAVATGRWLMRVGQAGITTLIDPQGVIHGRLGLFEPGLLRGTARLRADRTLFVRWGDWWMLLCGISLTALVLLRVGRRRTAA